MVSKLDMIVVTVYNKEEANTFSYFIETHTLKSWLFLICIEATSMQIEKMAFVRNYPLPQGIVSNESPVKILKKIENLRFGWIFGRYKLLEY